MRESVGVGGRTLRLLLALATTGALLSARAPDGITVDVVNVLLLAAVLGLMVMMPATAVPTTIGVIVVMTAVWSGIGFTVWLVPAASMLYTMHVLAGLCEVIPATARIERSALQPTLVRWVQVQLATVPPLAVLTALL